MQYKTDNKRIAKNTLFLYFRMMLMLLVSLYTSRLVLQTLGVEDYGTYNIVGGIVSIFTFISGAMVASTQRYLNFYLGTGDEEKLQKTFNVSLIIHLIVALLIIAFAETVGVWYIYNKLVIAPERLNAAFWTFQCSTIATAFIVMSFPYNAAITAREKMSTFAYITIYDACVKLLIVYAIMNTTFDKLVSYAILMMLAQISTTLIYRIYCIRHFKECKLNFKGLTMPMFKELLSFSGWNFVGNIANVCLTQGVNLLLNAFFGPAVNAARGISVQVQNSVSGFCTNFQNAQNPQIIKSYAAGEHVEMHKLIFRASRFSYFLMLLFSVPIIMKSDIIMQIWLKEPPEYTSIFVQYTMGFGLVQSLANPLLTGAIATGSVKKIMSIIATFFCMIIPVCYIALYFGADPVSVFFIQLIMYIIAHIIRLWIVSKQLNFQKNKYLKDVAIPCIYITIMSFVVAYLINLLLIDNIVNNLLFCLTSIASTAFIIVSIGLKGNEKKQIFNIIKKYGKIYSKKNA